MSDLRSFCQTFDLAARVQTPEGPGKFIFWFPAVFPALSALPQVVKTVRTHNLGWPRGHPGNSRFRSFGRPAFTRGYRQGGFTRNPFGPRFVRNFSVSAAYRRRFTPYRRRSFRAVRLNSRQGILIR